ncbi:DUF362 domain-containing protein [candidate division KSB1 bacterium]|nr:DUF362 domain-containing protein [candidate division KSB1 bacterium]
MKSRVYFLPANNIHDPSLISEHLPSLITKSSMPQSIERHDLVAIKIHIGEKGNVTHISPDMILPFSKAIIDIGGKPYLTDTNVLYRSNRSDAVLHMKLAQEHGFGLERCGAPFIIADGLLGNNEIDVEIDGKLFDSVSIAADAAHANSIVSLTHITGHLAVGLGGTLKNLGMGFASRKGKLRQHSSVKPWINKSDCTLCGECVKWCPEDAIELKADAAEIDQKLCIGCGECLTVCRFGAVEYNWRTSSADLQKKIAEHALGVAAPKKDKIFYFNFLINITKNCDCINTKQKPVTDDIGILASSDPVAIDTAALDLVEEYSGKQFRQLCFPGIDETIQLKHGETIGLGKMEYELLRL